MPYIQLRACCHFIRIFAAMTATWTYSRLNTLTGWTVFALSLFVYLSTVAPTASFWDCGEFIACANELEVTHPPGAPLFLLLGRIMAMLAGSPQKVAFMVNLLSVFSGAFTALFTCWSVTMLVRKALADSNYTEHERVVATLFAGAVAGLTCAFCDSVWFNSVEAEVYAMSGLCTATVVWLMLKWDAHADEPDNLRWIVLIAYIVGLSTGVHLLNLLTIPALAMVYYFRKYTFSWQGALTAFGIGVGILGAIQYGILQYTFVLAWQLEKFFTGAVSRDGTDAGGLGMPIGTGLMIEMLLIGALLIGGLVITYRKKQVVAHISLLACSLIMLGFSSYTVIIVRSGVTPPLDMNNPENVLTFLSYMRREQYGDRPLFRGVRYNAQPMADERGYAQLEDLGMQYILQKGDKKYVEDAQKQDYAYDPADRVFFPRMYDMGKYNAGEFGYRNYVKLQGRDENSPYDDAPTYGEDFAFFWDYQLRHMYWRYFMWNFAGKHSDIQDANSEGTSWTRPKHDHPDYIHNKGTNHFYYLPFLWGILGLIWHFTIRRRDAAFVGMLFFFTGIAIILYLNQTPMQPRERDYSYVGSFMTFAMWVGMGVLFMMEMLRKYLGHIAVWVAGVISLLIPGIMLVQGWDDHSRAGRWVDIEFAKNMLDSCAPNAILFTGGDNDTFPLWYVQEVEGYRTDVRLVNMELLHSDWYIDQMRLPQNGAAGIPLTMDSRSYSGEANIAFQGVSPHTVSLPVDKNALLAAGVLSPREAALADSVVSWKPRIRSYLLRRDSVAINMLQNIAADSWKRPVYFANMLGTENYLGLEDYMRVEGLAYRLIPVKRDSLLTINDPYTGTCAPDLMMKRMMQFSYRGLDDASVNLDEHIRGSIVNNYRSMFFRLAAAMQGERERLIAPEDAPKRAEWQQKIRQCFEFSLKKMPYSVVHPRLGNVIMSAQLADHADLPDLAEREFLYLTTAAFAELRWEVERKQSINLQSDIAVQSLLLRIQYLKENKREAEAQKMAAEVDALIGGSRVQEMAR